MSQKNKTGFALIIGLLLIAPSEWGRVREWFKDLKPLKQWIIAVSVALFIVVCIAVVIAPVLWDWIQYLT